MLEQRPLLSSTGEIWCDTSTRFARSAVPQPMRKTAFEAIHNQSDPGTKATSKLLTARYVWPNVRKDVRQWCKVCMECQRSKITQHNNAPVGSFAYPDARFDPVHIDVVGPLPTCQGCPYLFTMADRFSRWPEAVPITFLPKLLRKLSSHAGLQLSECPRLSRLTAVLNSNPTFFNP